MSAKIRVGPFLVATTALAAIPAVVGAQQAATEPGAGLEQITVTARRREENLQTVPIAVTVLPGEELREAGIATVRDLQSHVPSMVVSTQGVDRMVVGYGIRGQRSTSFLVLDDPAVSTYFAEGVQVRTYGFGDTLHDIQSIQVLKGAQGTLFGRNNTGGAVLIEPNKPDLAGFDAEATVGAGSFGLKEANGMANFRLAEKAALRLVAAFRDSDGYNTNAINGMKFDGEGYQAFRGSLLWKPGNISSNTIYDHLHADQSPSSDRLTGFTSLIAPGTGPTGIGTWAPLLAAQEALGDDHKFNTAVGTLGPNDGFNPARCQANPLLICRSSSDPKIKLTNWGVLNNTSVMLSDNLTLKNIVSYRDIKYDNEGVDNLSGGGVGIQSNQHNASTSVSEELQLQGKTGDGRLDWIAGAYYLRERGDEFAPNYQFSTASWNATTGKGENKSSAVFSQGTYRFTPALSATLGARYTWDEREATDLSYSTNGTTGAKTCQIRDAAGALLPGNACSLTDSTSSSEPTYTASVEYKPDNGMLLYGATRRGYKSGGFSLRAHRPQRFGYAPEYVTDYEGGLKADWKTQIPVRTNLAIYYSKYTDIQRQVTDTNLVPTVTYVFNAAKAHVQGAEFEFTVVPASGLHVSGYLSSVKARYDEYIDPATTAAGLSDPLRGKDLSGQPFVSIPEWQGALSVRYVLPVSSTAGEIALRADYFREGGFWWDPTLAAQSLAHQGAYGLLNLRAEWTDIMGSRVDFAVYGLNVNDTRYQIGGSIIAGIGVASFGPPRSFGAELKYRF